MFTTQHISESPVNAGYINGNDARNFGKLWNKDAKLFMRTATKPVGMISKEGYITVLSTTTQQFRDFLEQEKLQESNETRYYNIYRELITSDLSCVTPVVIGKLKNILTQFSSIQRGNLTEDSHVVIQVGEVIKCVTKFDLTNIYLGALPEYVIKMFVNAFKGFTPESIQFILEKGYNSELRPIVETIGTLDQSFCQEQYLWMKSLQKP